MPCGGWRAGTKFPRIEAVHRKQVQERYFLVGEREDGFTVFPPCTVRPELRPEDVDEGLLHFACYVAVCYTVYGASYDSSHHRAHSRPGFPAPSGYGEAAENGWQRQIAA